MSVFILEDEGGHTKTRKKYKTKYNVKYEADYRWVGPSTKGENYALCKWCNISICIGSVGSKGLRDHEFSRRHSRMTERVYAEGSKVQKPVDNDQKILQNMKDNIATSEHSLVTGDVHPNTKINILSLSTMPQYSQISLSGPVDTLVSHVTTPMPTHEVPVHVVSHDGLTQQQNGDTIMSLDVYKPKSKMVSCKDTIVTQDLLTTHPSLSGTIIQTTFSHQQLTPGQSALTNSVYPVLEADEGSEHHAFHGPKTPQTPNTPHTSSPPQICSSNQFHPTHLQIKDNLDNAVNISTALPHTASIFSQANQELCSAAVPVILDYNSTGNGLHSYSSDTLLLQKQTSVHTDLPPYGSQIEQIPINTAQKFTETTKEEVKPESGDDLKCDICGDEFTQWTVLKKHLVNHINDIKDKNNDNKSNKEDKASTKNKTPEPTSKIPTKVIKVLRKRGKRAPAKSKTKLPFDNDHMKNNPPLIKNNESPVKQIKDKLFENITKNDTMIPSITKVTSPNIVKNQGTQPTESIIVDPMLLLSQDNSSNNSLNPNEDFGKKICPIRCRVCKMVFFDKTQLKQHQQEEHNNGRPYQCITCSRFFTTKNNLEVHMKYKHKEGPNPCQCTICNKVLTSRANLRIHMKEVHVGEKPFQCNVCQKSFSRKANMEMHMVYHTGERRYTCEVCGQSFFAINALKRHTKLHSGVRDYRCDICDASYVTGTDLRRHRLKHEETKPHPCHLCEKQFTRAHDLKVHIRYHNKDLRFTCMVCEKQFVEAGNYKRHMRRHTGERPYTCKICFVTYSQVHHLKSHIRTSHGEESSSSNKNESSISRPSNNNKAPRQSHLKREIKSSPQIQTTVAPNISNAHLLPSHQIHLPSTNVTTADCNLLHPGVTTVAPSIPHTGLSGQNSHLPTASHQIPAANVNSTAMPNLIQHYNSHLYNHYPTLFDMCPAQQANISQNLNN